MFSTFILFYFLSFFKIPYLFKPIAKLSCKLQEIEGNFTFSILVDFFFFVNSFHLFFIVNLFWRENVNFSFYRKNIVFLF